MNEATHILAFLRHGEYHQKPNTPSALQHGALTTLGQQQAARAAEDVYHYAQAHGLRLHPEIDTSHSLRAWQTADTLKQTLKHQAGFQGRIVEQKTLHERSVGALANLSVTEIEHILEQDPRVESPPLNWKSDSHYRLPVHGAESLLSAGERVAGHLNRRFASLAQTETQPTLKIIVGHGASFRHAAFLLGLLSFEDIAQKSMHHARPLYFEYRTRSQDWRHRHGEWKQRARANPSMID
ncbi:MAG: histidine phosphatase family protein [Hydrogenovibrio sp.]